MGMFEVAGRGLVLLGLVNCTAFAGNPDILNPAWEATLSASDGSRGDWFGRSVSMSGTTVVVGAPRVDHAFGGAGKAYVFEAVDTAWEQRAILVASDPGPADGFGVSVAVDSDTLVVGSHFDSHSGAISAGSAYVFVRSGATWVEQVKLVAAAPLVTKNFGSSVAIDGDTLVVGSLRTDIPSGAPGGLFVFIRSGSQWIQQAVLQAPGVVISDGLGASVALHGDTIVAGAPASANARGAVYVWTRSGSAWTLQAQLEPTDAQPGDSVGASVDLDGNTLVAGAQYQAPRGAVYSYVRSGCCWTLDAKLQPGTTSLGSGFGLSLAIQGDRLIAARPGAVELFERTQGVWTYLGHTGQAGQFGRSVSLDGSRFVAGAPTIDNGRAWVYRREDAIGTYCSGKTNSAGCIPFISHQGRGYLPRASGGGTFYVEGLDVVPNEAGFLFYGLGQLNRDFHGGKLCVKPPFVRLSGTSSTKTGIGCSGWQLVRDFNETIQSGADPRLTAGQTVFLQWRQRDPSDPAGFGDALTNGLRLQIYP